MRDMKLKAVPLSLLPPELRENSALMQLSSDFTVARRVLRQLGGAGSAGWLDDSLRYYPRLVDGIQHLRVASTTNRHPDLNLADVDKAVGYSHSLFRLVNEQRAAILDAARGVRAADLLAGALSGVRDAAWLHGVSLPGDAPELEGTVAAGGDGALEPGCALVPSPRDALTRAKAALDGLVEYVAEVAAACQAASRVPLPRSVATTSWEAADDGVVACEELGRSVVEPASVRALQRCTAEVEAAQQKVLLRCAELAVSAADWQVAGLPESASWSGASDGVIADVEAVMAAQAAAAVACASLRGVAAEAEARETVLWRLVSGAVAVADVVERELAGLIRRGVDLDNPRAGADDPEAWNARFSELYVAAAQAVMLPVQHVVKLSATLHGGSGGGGGGGGGSGSGSGSGSGGSAAAADDGSVASDATGQESDVEEEDDPDDLVVLQDENGMCTTACRKIFPAYVPPPSPACALAR